MHICFVSYWGLDEGLTQAVVIPHLRILAERVEVTRLSLITVERNGLPGQKIEVPKLAHHSLLTSESLAKKLFDKNKAKRLLDELHSEHVIDLVIARTSLAGSLTLDFTKANRIPLIVESFEPYSEYMIESGAWKRMDPRYVMTKSAERRIKQHAQALLPVTRRYADYLIAEDEVDPERIKVMPTCVDTDKFAFDPVARAETRAKLRIGDDAIVAIYTGDKGGLELDQEAIVLMASAKHYYQDRFHLIVLSLHSEKWSKDLQKAGFGVEEFTVSRVPQGESSPWLSAADFAFSLHRPSPSMIGISPVKNAEYFANNLPVIMPAGIGDDAHEIGKWNLGVTFSMEEIDRQAMFNRLEPLIAERTTQSRIADWAKQRRSFDIVRKHYAELLKGLG